MSALYAEEGSSDEGMLWFWNLAQMRELIISGARIICESSVRNIPEHFEYLPSSVNIVISSKLAHHSNVSECITDAIFQNEAGELKDMFQTMLHEALMNALIHGNLEMLSNYDDFDAVTNYIDAITARLANDAVATLPLMVSIEKNQSAIYFSVTQSMGSIPQKLESGWDVADSRGFGLKIIENMSSEVLVYPNQKTLTVKILRK